MLSDRTASTAHMRRSPRSAEEGWVRPNKRIFNNEKISDHFAIIPTLQAPKHLSEPEQKLYDMVVKRSSPCSIPRRSPGHHAESPASRASPFKSDRAGHAQRGLAGVYGREGRRQDAPTSRRSRTASVEGTCVGASRTTKPPARYSERRSVGMRTPASWS